MAEKAQAKELFWLVAAIPWGGAAYWAMKRSACIEGARMALARGKTYWAEMDATAVASRGSDKSRFPTEHYFEEVLQGARIIESQCSKDVMFE